MADTARAIDALHSIPPDLPRDEWVKVGMAAHAAGLDFDTFDAWSAGAGNYDAAASRDTWRSFKPGKGIGPGTLYRVGAEHGWRMGEGKPQQRPMQAPRKAAEPQRKPAPGQTAAEVWERCEPATAAHGYIVAKAAAGVPLNGLRVLPAGDALRIAGQSMAGALVVPAYGPQGLQSLQLIPPPGAGKKMNLPGAPMAGASFTVGDVVPGAPVALCEGIGQAWACWQATGHPAVACFGWGNVGKVAEALRQRDAAARLVLVPDVGKEESAAEIAQALQCAVAYMPEGEPQNFDANDLAQRDGHDVLAGLLEDAREPAPPGLPLSVAFADELPEAFTPPDELVEGVLTAGDGSVLYGDSNSGKTFFVIDMAAAVARGARWMGRNTEPGLVLYLAAESPASVRGRLQAYQRHHGVRVPNFAIVQSPIDLFDGDADTEAFEVPQQSFLRVLSGSEARLRDVVRQLHILEPGRVDEVLGLGGRETEDKQKPAQKSSERVQDRRHHPLVADEIVLTAQDRIDRQPKVKAPVDVSAMPLLLRRHRELRTRERAAVVADSRLESCAVFLQERNLLKAATVSDFHLPGKAGDGC